MAAGHSLERARPPISSVSSSTWSPGGLVLAGQGLLGTGPDDPDDPPALELGQGAGFHDLDHVARCATRWPRHGRGRSVRRRSILPYLGWGTSRSTMTRRVLLILSDVTIPISVFRRVRVGVVLSAGRACLAHQVFSWD